MIFTFERKSIPWW